MKIAEEWIKKEKYKRDFSINVFDNDIPECVKSIKEILEKYRNLLYKINITDLKILDNILENMNFKLDFLDYIEGKDVELWIKFQLCASHFCISQIIDNFYDLFKFSDSYDELFPVLMSPLKVLNVSLINIKRIENERIAC